MRLSPLLASVLIFVACRDNYDDFQPDPLSGDWELVSVEGVAGCTATSGTLQVVEIEGMGFSGDFNWSASCEGGSTISEAGDVASVEVDVSGRDYGIDITLHTPEVRALDWDCTMAGNELECIESDAVVKIYAFTRQP